jgi:hypothetical protein
VPRRAGVVAALALAVVWLLLGVGLVLVVVLERATLSDLNCPVPGLDSVYGEASWQSWPPGEVCTLGDARIDGPSTLRGAAIVAEVVVAVGLLVLWRRLRDAPDPDWTT